MKTIFFFLTPLVTILLFFQTTGFNPLSEIVINTETGTINNHDYIQLNFLDGHNLKMGDGWRDIEDSNGIHKFYSGSSDSKDPFAKYRSYATVWGYTAGTAWTYASATSNSSSCTPVGATYAKGSTINTNELILPPNNVSSDCYVGAVTWDISPISIYATVTNVNFRFDVIAVSNTRNCDFTQMTYQAANVGAQTVFEDVVGIISDTDYISDTADCVTVANNYVKDLGANADSDLQSHVSDASGWFGLGFKYANMVRSAGTSSANLGAALSAWELEITYTAGSPPVIGAPDQVTGLTATANSSTQITLDWTAPGDGGSAITGYFVEYESPINGGWHTLTSNTGSTAISLINTGLSPGTQYNYRVSAINAYGTGAASAEADATTSGSACTHAPNKVSDLNTYTIENNRIGLTWTEPNLFGCSIIGYMINYTTPYSSNPSTILQSNTAGGQTNYLVNGLTKNTQYSFRIGTITAFSTNATGNVKNATTTNLDVPDLFGGGFNFTQTNTMTRKIIFEEDPINDNDKFLNVTYPDTYNMTCNIAYKYAMTNTTYSNLSYVTQGSDRESSFRFNNFTNDVIYVNCYDEDTGDFAKHILIQTEILYLQIVEGFQSGDYGTFGMMGILDIVTLLAIIAAMIGLNEVNESVGGIFVIAIVGGLWWVGIIQLPTLLISSLIMAVFIIITQTRKE